jgi:APA family basic amino acid/polyamine antiporter
MARTTTISAGGSIMSVTGASLGAAVADEGLRRGLGRIHVLAIVVGGTLGAAIYLRPAVIAQLVQTPARVLLVWCLAGLLSLTGALTYAELAARFPRSGGEYVFLRETLGELPAFLSAWMRLTLGVANTAALAAGVAVFLSELVPLPHTTWHLGFSWIGRRVTIDLGAHGWVAALIILILGLLNISGVVRAGRFQGAVTAAKVAGLVGLIAAITIVGEPHAAVVRDLAPAPAPPGALAYGAAFLAAIATYHGWASASMVAGEVRNAPRTLPWAIVSGLVITTILYIAANVAYFHVLTVSEVATSHSTAYPDAPSVAGRAAAKALGFSAGRTLSLLFLLSTLGTLHCVLLVVPRMFFAAARDGLLPAALGDVAESARTPAVAIGTLALLAMILALLSGYDRLSNMATFGNLLFYALSAFGLLWWRRGATMRDDSAFFHAPRGVPQLFLLGSVALLIALIAGRSAEVVAAIAVLGLGVPVYALIRRRRFGRHGRTQAR